MLINYVSGDIFANANHAKAFALDCNIEGVMNTQMGVAFRSQFPQMYQDYLRMCEANPPQIKLGEVFMWKNPANGFIVFNLAIHASRFYTLASGNMIEQAFRNMRKLADQEGVLAIAMPPIGGGMGNLNWDKSKRSLERSFNKWQGKFYVYMKPTGKWS